MTLYFNHAAMENASTKNIHDYLEQIIKLKAKGKEEEENICFYQEFWDVRFSGMNLRSYLCQLNDKEPVKGVITSVMNGPYYYNNIEINQVSSEPNFDKKPFCELLFNICFKDNQHKVLSLKEEKFLRDPLYNIKRYIDTDVSFDIFNLIGEKGLEEFFVPNSHFNNIQQVYDKLENKYSNLIILDSAKKSGKRHDFRGCYQEIYNGISSLVDIELPLLIEGENDEVRKKRFHEASTIEISKETSETLAVDRYRKEREFNIPKLGRMLCEWHLKIDGNHTRIHYHIDKKSKKVYIAHCGKHLSTAGYKS